MRRAGTPPPVPEHRRLVATVRRKKVKAVYFVSYFSNPSGRSLSAEEKRTLATTLSAQGFVVPIVEDAAYR